MSSSAVSEPVRIISEKIVAEWEASPDLGDSLRMHRLTELFIDLERVSGGESPLQSLVIVPEGLESSALKTEHVVVESKVRTAYNESIRRFAPTRGRRILNPPNLIDFDIEDAIARERRNFSIEELRQGRIDKLLEIEEFFRLDHADDFSWVRLVDRIFEFASFVQQGILELLCKDYRARGEGVSRKAIWNRLVDRGLTEMTLLDFKVPKAFRIGGGKRHEALGTLIVEENRKYKINRNLGFSAP